MSKKNRNKNQTSTPAQEVETPETEVIEETIAGDSEVMEPEQAPEELEATTAEPTTEEETEAAPAEEQSEVEETVEEAPVSEEKVEEVIEATEPEKAVEDSPVVDEKEVVVKPIINKGILKVEKRVSTKAAVTIPQTEGVLKFNAIAQKYIELMGTGKIDEDARRRALIVLANMCNFICNTSDPAVFDTCLRFFMENRSIRVLMPRASSI